ncbi:DNA (cytosine-5)-methyltransferase 1 [Spiroplasma sp. NBRC 100390]|uniref:DNA cytosine methyltransferase n=1 Tax=unclassified Spiroplasma TaxID=2637901 RepID=UPI0008928178|nr:MULTISPECIES: DNA cytosine methyltransferase [unclassified Spiroplasma]AOX43735.1 DNA (cytosine-5)-methyltransferase 1 [Spiroplasma sp. TU-14]APE13205.1 DNA (cytosine-5)-methyltransferase 1 [Spiroplasma sp. NBRC 100390]
MIKGASLFSNVGIDEFYLNDADIEIVLANELLKKRADFYSHIYPNVDMICGDITDKNIFKLLVDKFIENECDFLLATPPCQGMSIAGKMNKNDERNKLIIQVIEFIKKTRPANIIIENVTGLLKFPIWINKNQKILIKDYIINSLESIGYYVNYGILDAADYDTPHFRKRAIFLISKYKLWEFPEKKNHITVREAIGKLPSLESGESSDIKYHYAKRHNDRHILWMKHTPTGTSAYDNEIFYPQKKDGSKIKGYSTTYKRIWWDKPAPTITMGNGSISSQNNVHPGRLMKNNLYSDARVLTILELLRLVGLPDDWNIPEWASDNLIRHVLGECFPPKFALNLVMNIPKTIIEGEPSYEKRRWSV